MIPGFPDFKQLELADKELVSSCLYNAEPELSELGFASLYSWRGFCKTCWCIADGLLLFLEQGEDGSRYFLPPVGASVSPAIVRELLLWLKERFPDVETTIERAGYLTTAELDDRFIVEPQPEHFDYLYRRTAIAGLQGTKLRGKRSQIRKLEDYNGYRTDRLLKEHLPGCRRVNQEWQEWRGKRADSDEADAVSVCLDNFEQLQLEGTVILIDGRIEGFSVSERLNSNTMVVHFEKASPRYPDLFSALIWQSCNQYDEEIEWINRAQDKGLPGLRQAKRSWNPTRMIEKFRISLR